MWYMVRCTYIFTYLQLGNSHTSYWSSGNWPFPSASPTPTAFSDDGVVLRC